MSLISANMVRFAEHDRVVLRTQLLYGVVQGAVGNMRFGFARSKKCGGHDDGCGYENGFELHYKFYLVITDFSCYKRHCTYKYCIK